MAFNLGFPLVGAVAPGMAYPPTRRSWQERLFDRLMPESSASLVGVSGADKKALVRQGLLQLAAGIQSSPNFGQGLTQGLLAGSQGINQGVEDIQARRLREQQLLNYQNSALPAGYRELDLMAKAAGHQPGTAGYRKFFEVKGGLAARQVTGARKNVMIRGADGIERPGVFDPSSPYGYSVYDETAGQFRPLEAGETPTQEVPAMPQQPMGGAIPQAGGVFSGMGTSIAQDVERQIGRPLTPQERAQIGDGSQPFNLQFPPSPQAPPMATPQPQMAPPPRTAAPAALAVSRSPEQQAALTTAAEEEAKLAALPRRVAIEAEGAGLKTTAEAQAKVAAERVAKEQQKAIDATERADLLNQAEMLLPQASSGGLQRRGAESAAFFGLSTPGAQATAGLNTIAARLVAKVPRFEGPQSDKDVQSYREAAGNLADANLPVQTRLAALRTMRALDAKYGTGGGATPKPAPTAPKRLKFNPATGRIE